VISQTSSVFITKFFENVNLIDPPTGMVLPVVNEIVKVVLELLVYLKKYSNFLSNQLKLNIISINLINYDFFF
jgi:hypothetical protein